MGEGIEEESVWSISSRRASSDWVAEGCVATAAGFAVVVVDDGALWCRASGRVTATSSAATAVHRAGNMNVFMEEAGR
jgi:hypothetical protein